MNFSLPRPRFLFHQTLVGGEPPLSVGGEERLGCSTMWSFSPNPSSSEGWGETRRLGWKTPKSKVCDKKTQRGGRELRSRRGPLDDDAWNESTRMHPWNRWMHGAVGASWRMKLNEPIVPPPVSTTTRILGFWSYSTPTFMHHLAVVFLLEHVCVCECLCVSVESSGFILVN